MSAQLIALSSQPQVFVPERSPLGNQGAFLRSGFANFERTMTEMLVVVGLILWAAVGAALGLIAGTDAFAQGWSEAGPDRDSEDPPQKATADDPKDRRQLIAGTVAAVVAGAVSMTVITGETAVGLMVSIPVAGIGAAAVLVIMSALALVPSDDSDHNRDQTPFDQ